MTVEEILTAISTVGFPIVACSALFYYHVKVITNMIETVKNNTSAIENLTKKLG